MIGWRRRAKEARDSTVSPERLYELVSQTLMENFGPLGSFAITRRSTADTDDIFHTALARSVARDIVANLSEHGITVRSTLGRPEAPVSLAPIERVAVPRQLARAVASATAGPVAVPALAPAGPVAVPALVPAAAAVTVSISDDIPVEGPDPRDDDALRALVAHHAEVTEAAARNHNQVRWVI